MLIVLTTLFVLITGGWWFFLYQPLKTDLAQEKKNLNALQAQLNRARQAEKNIDEVEAKIQKIKVDLATLESKFLDKNNLSAVMNSLQKMAKKFGVELVDFTPVLDTFFSKKSSQKIISLPIRITITGRYVNIGKFLEKWKDFQFYLIPFQISLEKKDPESNDLNASVITNLYIWNQ